MQAALPATQTYLSALATALAAWSAAAPQAAAARDDRLQAAQQTYAQRLQDLQSQADEAWQDYASALLDAGCVPQDVPPQCVSWIDPDTATATIKQAIATGDVATLAFVLASNLLSAEQAALARARVLDIHARLPAATASEAENAAFEKAY